MNPIAEELENMAQVGDLDQIWSKRKAIVALFPYIVWQDQGGNRRVVDAFLGIAKTPKIGTLLAGPITRLFEEASPDSTNRLVMLLSPYACWGSILDGNTATWWAAAVTAVPYTEEVGQSVVDTLLQIVSEELCMYIPIDTWAWLTKRPYLPPICEGRLVGTMSRVVRRVRELGDVEILESYLLLVWSEYDTIYLSGITEMCASIREDLGGIGMGRHREVLIDRLDHILGQLDMGLEYLEQQNPDLEEYHVPEAKAQYKKLKRVLLEVDRETLEVLTRMPFKMINSFNLLTPVDDHRIPLNVHLCAPSPVSVVVCPRLSLLDPPTPCFICTRVPICGWSQEGSQYI